MLKKILAFLYAILINVFFLALCLAFGDLKFGAIDDYFMAAVLTGAHGNSYNPHLVFVNAVYGYALLPLYHLFPKVGWYYIGEMASVFLCFATISTILIRHLGSKWGVLLATLFVAFFASDFYLVLQFTQCASLLSATGMVTMAAFVGRKRIDSSSRDLAVLFFALFLFLWGSVMRWQAFLMGMPFFALGLLFLFKDCWRHKVAVSVTLAAMFLGAFALHSWDASLYKAPEFKEFNAIQQPRVTLGDVRNYNMNATYEDLEELGLSGGDYHLLTEWNFYDTEAFSADSLHAYTHAIEQYKDESISKRQIPAQLISALQQAIRAPLFWAWFLFCILVYVTNREKKIRPLYLWASLGTVFFLMTMLLTIGRLVYRVESGFWLYAAIMAIPLIGEIKWKFPKALFVVAMTAIAIVNIATYAKSGNIVRSPNDGSLRTLTVEDSTDYNQFFAYIDSQPDKMFLMKMGTYMRFSHHKNPPYKSEPIGSFKNTISFGYWTPYLPQITASLKEYGITNPMKQVVDSNVIVIDEAGLGPFLQRHYYDSVAVDTLRTFGERTFYKYRIVENGK